MNIHGWIVPTDEYLAGIWSINVKKKKSSSKKEGDKRNFKKLDNSEKDISMMMDENQTEELAIVDDDVVDCTTEKISPLNLLQNDEEMGNRSSIVDAKNTTATFLQEKKDAIDRIEKLNRERRSMDIINDILNPPMLQFDKLSLPYNVPAAVKAGDIHALQDLDERKIIELKEAFFLFDLNGDGYIDAKDLRATFITLGQEAVPDNVIEQMLSEAPSPLDFDGFVLLLGYKTIELDPEEVLIEALSKWDIDKCGYISEDKLRNDLMSYGDRFTEDEATYALEEAPIVNKNRTHDEPVLIDYQSFCKILACSRNTIC